MTVEERLIEKIAEFEGKVEALQSLKANLYEAIEQLDKEQRDSQMQDKLAQESVQAVEAAVCTSEDE